jgi:hypothetical protein
MLGLQLVDGFPHHCFHVCDRGQLFFARVLMIGPRCLSPCMATSQPTPDAAGDPKKATEGAADDLTFQANAFEALERDFQQVCVPLVVGVSLCCRTMCQL